MQKLIFLLLGLFAVVTSSCSKESKAEPVPSDTTKVVQLSMVDKNATEETKALYSQLWKIQSVGAMFGHHEGLAYGRKWNNEPGRSDVKDVCGDFPAVCSMDFSKIEHNSPNSINGIPFTEVRRCIQEARRRGEVILMCWHVDNPLTGGTAWDNSNNTVVKQILQEGSEMNVKFKSWLDNLVNFNKTLVDDNGKPIPVIFRPFHEHTQTWNWWGKSCTTDMEFIDFWRFMVTYLRDTKGVHNFIYAISPQMDGVQPKSDLLFRWPGDAYVDFLGMDCYHGTNTAAFVNNLANITAISKEKRKPCGVTETGLEGIRKDGVDYVDYWTREMLTPIIGRKISLLVMWRNAYDPTGAGSHFYAPFAGQASADDFVKFYNSPVTLFSKDLPDMYKMADGVAIQ